MTKRGPKGPITIGGKGEKTSPGFWDSPTLEPDLFRKSCHESHPDLHIGSGTLKGGNCRDHTRHTGVALYVALDGSMKHPLFEATQELPRCVYYPIQNMGVPNNVDKFHQLVITILAFLEKGKTVHVGCIGGHGRTGLVIAAVVAMLPDVTDDPIKWVRENYCKKAIESKSQENFLAAHYGCPLPPARVDKSNRVR